MINQDDDNARFKVLIDNRKLEYSIWPIDLEIPVGLKETGAHGRLSECFSYVKEMVMLWPL
jgi:uncharacterized protein YbdZ (MbtH family)